MCFKRQSFLSNIVSIAVIMTALVAAVRVNAATVTSANDFITTLQTSQSANHEVLFTTPSGIAEGSTVSLTFDSAFNTSSLTGTDVDIADNGVELTTAANCSGSENASVVITSHVITVTICTGNGGAIAAGHTVRFRVGTNAVSSGTGTHHVVNPSTAGIHFVSIFGSFGDSGTILLPINTSADGIGVSAIVGAISSPPGGGGCSGDCTAPVISGILVSGITATSATINWTTDESATSGVEYGVAPLTTPGSVSDSALVKTHSVVLTGLTEGASYAFLVKSSDAVGNHSASSVVTFTTLDVTAPVISSIVVDAITKTSAHFSWTTNENATSVVEFGTSVDYGSVKSDASLVKSHSITLTGLSNATPYHFRVKSEDAATNIAVSSDDTFTTLVDLPPTNVSGLVITAGDKSLSLSWTNPLEVDFVGVKILRCLTAYPTSPVESTCRATDIATPTATFSESGLTNGTTYYYGVFAKNAAGQFASGALVSGKPSASEIKLPIDTCGDKICGITETALSCPTDCSLRAADVCGDRICGRTESVSSCPVDCSVPPPGGTCGDGVCASSESAFTCPSDCHVVLLPVKPVTGTDGSTVQTFQFTDVMFTAASGKIPLTLTSGYIEALPHTGISVRVPASVLGKNVKQVTIVIGADTYIMRPMTTLSSSSRNVIVAASSSDVTVLSYSADILAPSSPSLSPVTIFVDYLDGSLINVSSFLRVIAPGYTHEIIDGEEAIAGGVTVTLYEVHGNTSTVWDGSPYGQMNPTTSSSDGTFAWYVPNGTYKVHGELATVKPLDTAVFSVSNSIANPRLVLTPLPKKVEGAPKASTTSVVLSTMATTQEVATSVVKNLAVIAQSPIAQTAAVVSLPVLTVSAGASIIVLSTAFDFLPFLQYLLTAPFLLFWRKKRKGYGVIYNAVSKEPIGLAVVRLYQVKVAGDIVGKLVKSRVTDNKGRFFFLVQPGLYRLTVTKLGYQFPSTFLQQKKEDVQYLDLYHGELVNVTEKDAVITPNVPLDPAVQEAFHEPKQLIFRARLQFVQHFVALFGTFASLGFALIRPSVLAAVMVLIQMAIYLAVKRLAKPRKPKSWGIVYDQKTGRPVANAVARIFEPKYNKLLDTQVTDNRGRYSFLLGPSEYFAVFEKEGYRPTKVTPIDYTHVDGAEDFSVDVKLEGK